jgi:hypothetical protein
MGVSGPEYILDILSGKRYNFLTDKRKAMHTVQLRVQDRIRAKGRGNVFASKDFLDLGGRDAVDQALSRLAKAGELRRLGRGLYYYPRTNQRLGLELPPDPDEIASALARRTGTRVAPSGALAANRFGLTTQVPAKPVYLTDGRTRRVRAGDTVFLIQHVPAKDLPAGSPTSAVVFQALRHVGREAVDDQVLSRLRRVLSAKDRQRLLRDSRYTTGWIADVVRKVATEDEVEETVNG